MYRESLVFFKFYILSLFLVNGPQTLYINPGYLKCILDIDLSPANSNLLTISLILHRVLTC